MSKKSRFRGPIDKQDGKLTQTLLKSEAQHLYHIYWSLLRQLKWKKSLWLRSKILGQFPYILAANDKYPVLNSYKLMIPIKMQLYEKEKTVSEFFSAFLNSRLNFEHFDKKDDPHRFSVCEMTDSENVVR